MTNELTNELLHWKVVESLLTNVLCIAIIVALSVVVYKMYQYYKFENAGTCDQGHENLILALYMLLAVPLSYIDLIWLQIWLAPKVYIIEYVVNMGGM